MDWEQFVIGFWHPFGPHSDETEAQILERKVREIEANGWTLWSFQYRPMLAHWHLELTAANPDKVWVLCSAGGGRDPLEGSGARVRDCRSYRLAGESAWRSFPNTIRVPHAMRPAQDQVSVFVVQRVIHPLQMTKLPEVEWLSKAGWRTDGLPHYGNGLPTRGEYLIRRGGSARLRPCAAVLDLRPPYLAVASTELAETCSVTTHSTVRHETDSPKAIHPSAPHLRPPRAPGSNRAAIPETQYAIIDAILGAYAHNNAGNWLSAAAQCDHLRKAAQAKLPDGSFAFRAMARWDGKDRTNRMKQHVKQRLAIKADGRNLYMLAEGVTPSMLGVSQPIVDELARHGVIPHYDVAARRDG
jgi:hypothetical protein